MINFKKIKGIILDYGATIDSNGKHWSEILWNTYKEHHIPVTKEIFLEAYIFGEQYLATHSIIKSQDAFQEVLLKKTNLQISWLIKKGYLPAHFLSYSLSVSKQCYNFVCSVLTDTLPVLKILYDQYPLVLISNFYGNIQTVLKDFKLDIYFKTIIESAIVKIRKPDPKIFEMGIKALNLRPEQIAVIGDSYKKDIVPAQTLGCQTIWLKGSEWRKETKGTADLIIHDFKELKALFNKRSKNIT